MKKMILMGFVLFVVFMFGDSVFATTKPIEYRGANSSNLDNPIPIIPKGYHATKPSKAKNTVVYQEKTKTVIYVAKLTSEMYINNEKKTITGYAIKDTYYVPLRQFITLLGGQLVYNTKTKQSDVYLAKTELICQLKAEGKKVDALVLKPTDIKYINTSFTKTKMISGATYVDFKKIVKALHGLLFEDNWGDIQVFSVWNLPPKEFYSVLMEMGSCPNNRNDVVKNYNPTKKDIEAFIKKHLKGFFIANDTSPFGNGRGFDYIKYSYKVIAKNEIKYGMGYETLNEDFQKLYQEPHDFRIILQCDSAYDCSQQALSLNKFSAQQEVVFKSLINKFPNTKFYGFTKNPTICKYPNLNMDCSHTEGLHWSNYSLNNKSLDGFYASERYGEASLTAFTWDSDGMYSDDDLDEMQFNRGYKTNIVESASGVILDVGYKNYMEIKFYFMD
jgi:hypothetical protein